MYDDASGGTFYGEAKPRQDYQAYAAICQSRAAQFDHIVAATTNQLIAEAGTLRSPLEAIMRLDKISERLCVQYAIQDSDINAAVFGKVSAGHIADARFFTQQGAFERAETSLRLAQNSAKSGSCPLYNSDSVSSNQLRMQEGNSEGEMSGKKWMKCPHCSAAVFDDPCAKVLSCWDCSALVINGQVRSTGNGGSKARGSKHQSKQVIHKPKVTEQSMASPNRVRMLVKPSARVASGSLALSAVT